MICPHCGQNIPDEGFACPKCGKALPRDRTTMSGARPEIRPTPVAAAPNRKPVAIAGVLAAIVIVLLLILLLRPKPPVYGGNAGTPPPTGPAVTQAPTPAAPNPGPPVTGATTPQAPKIPAEDPNKKAIEDYLQKVSYIEKQRQLVVNDLTEALLVMQLLQSGMNDPLLGSMSDLLEPDPEEARKAKQQSKTETPDQAQQVISDKVAQLKVLDDRLKATGPIPGPAMPFARAYNESFYRYAGAMIQIGQVMQQAKADPSKAPQLATGLSSMKGSLGSSAAQGLAAADQQLTVLCQKYGITKPFDVTDTPAGGVTGM